MKRALIILCALTLAACSAGLESEGGLDFSFEQTLDDLRNCDLLSETFVTVIKEATDQIDDLAATNERIPTAELSARVDDLTQSGYFAVAERLGCNAVAQRVETIERLREIDPSSEDGRDLVGAVIEELQAR